MAEISSAVGKCNDTLGKEDKNVEKGGSFKLFGRSPARSSSKKKSNNPLSRMFSRKKSEKQNVPDAEGYSSNSDDDDTRKQGEIDAVQTILKIPEVTLTEVADEVVHHANIQTFAQETVSANPDAEAKESTQATDDKKPEFFGKLLEKAKQTKGELLEDAEKIKGELLDKVEKTKGELLEKGNESLQEVFKALTHTNKTPIEQPIDDKNTSQENSVKILANDEVKGPNLAQRLQDEVVAAIGISQERNEEALQEQEEETLQEKREVTPHEENHDNVMEEENCVASLAQGLQKICSTWSNNKED